MLPAFLYHLHRGGAFGYYHILPERRSRWYSLEHEVIPDIDRIRTNLYFGVHPVSQIPPTNAHGEVRQPRFVRSQLWSIAAVNCLFAEYDCKDWGSHDAIITHIDQLPTPPPSVIVDSGGGMHAYWLLTEPYHLINEDRRDCAKMISRLWVALVKGDPGAKDLCRVLRLPGSMNYKYDPPRRVRWFDVDLDRTYTLDDLTGCIPPVEVRPARQQVDYAMPGRIDLIGEYNQKHDVGAELERHGYAWRGRRKMISPYSSTGIPGVTVDTAENRAFIHHSSDPLHSDYWRRPFDVVCTLDHGGDVKATLRHLRSVAR
jgi:hypothetical protein